MRWAEIIIEATAESAEAAENILIEEGCGGTATSRSSNSSMGTFGPNVMGYLPVDDRLEDCLNKIRTRVRQLPEFGLKLKSEEITVKFVEDEEWGTAWKKFFKPINIGKVVIKPTWEEYNPAEGEIIVEIDPGMAFGTGSHPTTKLCILTLQDYIKGGENVLDVGTGSAILAIAAAKLGAFEVVGIENDPVAVDTAVKNVELANMQKKLSIILSDTPLAYKSEADIVVANIIPPVIIAMAEQLYAKVKPGGKLITSGIVIERADDVRTKLESLGLKTIEQRQEGDWVAIISERVR